MSALTWFGIGCAVFLAATIYDGCVARYVAAAADRRAGHAACWSVATGVLSLVGILGVLRISAWLAIPEVLGFFVGTYISISRSTR